MRDRLTNRNKVSTVALRLPTEKEMASAFTHLKVLGGPVLVNQEIETLLKTDPQRLFALGLALKKQAGNPYFIIVKKKLERAGYTLPEIKTSCVCKKANYAPKTLSEAREFKKELAKDINILLENIPVVEEAFGRVRLRLQELDDLTKQDKIQHNNINHIVDIPEGRARVALHYILENLKKYNIAFSQIDHLESYLQELKHLELDLYEKSKWDIKQQKDTERYNRELALDRDQAFSEMIYK